MLEWRELFIPTILERGKKILHNNISDVHITEEGIRARVKGTEEYDLLIRTGLNEMTCTCPFAMHNNLVCKHMAALLIFCENNWSEGMAGFFKDSENSPLGKLAIKYKVNRLEKELINAEKLAEKAGKARWIEEREKKHIERLKAVEEKLERLEDVCELAEEKLRKLKAEGKLAEEKLRKLKAEGKLAEEKLGKLKAEGKLVEEKLRKLKVEGKLAEEKLRKLKAEGKLAEEKRIKEQKEREKILSVREINAKHEGERIVQENGEQCQKNNDKVVTRRRGRLPQAVTEELAKIDEQINRLEEAERDPGGGEFDIMPDSERVKETGWYYSDDDLLEGDYFVDKDGKEYFVPEGFQPKFHK